MKVYGLLSLLLITTPGLAQTPCDTPVSHVSQTAEAGLDAFTRMDAATVLSSHASSLAALECVNDIVPTEVAARLHFIDGVGAFFDKDLPRTRQAFRAALELDPTLQLPEAMQVDGHPLFEAMRAASLDQTPEGAPISPPPQTQVYVNGTQDGVRRPDRPAIVQIVSTSTSRPQVVWSGDLAASAPLPDWATVLRTPEPDPVEEPPPPPVELPPPPPPPEPAAIRGAWPWYVGAVVAAGAAGGTYLAAQHQVTVFHEPDKTREEVETAFRLANQQSAIASGSAIASVGLAGTGVVFHVRGALRKRASQRPLEAAPGDQEQAP